MLAGGAALAALGVTASACDTAPEPPPATDELAAQLAAARHDSDLAAAAAAGQMPEVAAALTRVAAERARHAQALAAQIDRVLGRSATTSSETSPAPAGPPQPEDVPAAPAPPPSLADVVNALRGSAAGAGQLAATSSGYQAGLLGSIAAACTAAGTVALAFAEAEP